MDVNSRWYKLLEEALDEVNAESSPYEVTNEIVIERYNKKLKEALVQEMSKIYLVPFVSTYTNSVINSFFES